VSNILNKVISFVLALIAWAACTSVIHAQSIPGIYGGGPLSELGTYRYVQFQGASGDTYTLPLNGILNYVGYYIPSSGAFIPGGEYSVYYLNSAQAILASAGTVTYSPNSGYTNGVEVSPPNPGATGALGISGTFTVEGTPFPGATVTLYNSSLDVIATATTNGDGFFSLYYGPSLSSGFGFVPAGSYQVTITYSSRRPPRCIIDYRASVSATYSPTNTTNPTLSSFYVANAVTNLGTVPATTVVIQGCS
jgi:hypothetical protein